MCTDNRRAVKITTDGRSTFMSTFNHAMPNSVKLLIQVTGERNGSNGTKRFYRLSQTNYFRSERK